MMVIGGILRVVVVSHEHLRPLSVLPCQDVCKNNTQFHLELPECHYVAILE